MDMELPFFPVLSAILLLVFLVKYWRSKPTYRLPPGPPKIPVIGNLHQMAAAGELPHFAMAKLAKEHGPIMHMQMGEHNFVVVSSSEIAEEILKTKEIIFAQRPRVIVMEILAYNKTGFVTAPYGDYWRQIRKICVLDLLSAKRVKGFRSIREEEVWNMVEEISRNQGSVMNLSPLLFDLTSNVTSRAAFGFKCSEQKEFTTVLDQTTILASGFNLADFYPSIRCLPLITGLRRKINMLTKRLSDVLDVIMEQNKERREKRRRLGSDDEESSSADSFLDVLIDLQESDKDLNFTDNHLKSITLEMFGAGSDSAAAVLEWAMAELLKNPTVMKKVQDEVREVCRGKTKIEEEDLANLPYMKLVVKETLRMHPPTVLLGREAREKCEIAGYEIPKETRIIINTWLLARDPKAFPEPNVFKPERFLSTTIDLKGTNYEFLAFGAGRRMCPGMTFGTANVELGLASILYHFDWKIPNDVKPEEFDMSERLGASSRKKHNLELIPITYVPFKK